LSHKVNVAVEKVDYGYYAYSPELEGCQSQGESYEEVLANIREAVELYLETLQAARIAAAPAPRSWGEGGRTLSCSG
jgi:predicted RNase H-like HicB family nuclease